MGDRSTKPTKSVSRLPETGFLPKTRFLKSQETLFYYNNQKQGAVQQTTNNNMTKTNSPFSPLPKGGRGGSLLLILGTIALLTSPPAPIAAQLPPTTIAQSSQPADLEQLKIKALTLWSENKFDEALALLQQVLAIQEQTLGPDKPEIAETLNLLASLYGARGDYSQMEPLYQRSLSIYQKAFNLQHPGAIDTLFALASFYVSVGNYQDAETLYDRALAIHQQLNYPDALTRNTKETIIFMGYGFFQQLQGNYAEAETYLQRSLAIEKQLYQNSQVPPSSYYLAILYLKTGNYAKAESLLQDTLAIESQNPYNPGMISFGYLGELYLLQGKYQEAESALLKAKEAYYSILQDADDYVPNWIDFNLAQLYQAEGNYQQAEQLLQAFITHPKLQAQNITNAYYLEKLASFYWRQGKIPNATQFHQQTLAVQERNIASILPLGSERRKRDYMKQVAETTHSFISFHLQAAPDSLEAAKVAATAILQRKGRLLDTLAYNLQLLQERLSPEERKLFEELNSTRSQLAALVFKGIDGRQQPQQLIVTQQQSATLEAIANLEREADRLESLLNTRSVEFLAAESPPVTIDAVKNLIPQDAALVELMLYQPVDPTATATASVPRPPEKFGQPRYAAYILFTTGELKWVDLGEAAVIDEAVLKLRRALRQQPPSGDRPARLTGGGQLTLPQIKELARELDALVMEPIRPLLADKTNLLIAPDGQLNLVPFGVLVDEGDRFLVETYTITYLTSGRDLLRLQLPKPETQPPLVLGNPDFDRADSVVVARGSRGSNTRSLDLTRLQYEELPGTKAEIEAIAPLFPEATVVEGVAATEAAIKEVERPEILHLATHGFFLSNATTQTAAIENPLLRSGLALAGFNSRDESATDSDGVLTALEVAALNLRGTELVVLSACETGLGDVANGDGVYGLRRAFTIAGAESQLMSLWKVSDFHTQEMMVGYYQRLKNGMGRSEAMRDVQLEMLQKYEYPYYWGSFIPVGNWQPMLTINN